MILKCLSQSYIYIISEISQKVKFFDIQYVHWLSHLGSNQNQQSQSLLCYRYTMAQYAWAQGYRRWPRVLSVQTSGFFQPAKSTNTEFLCFYTSVHEDLQ